jgi:hypothetical protein
LKCSACARGQALSLSPIFIGDDTELVECAEHNPAYRDAPSVDELLTHLGKVTGFDAADAERSAIIDNLTSEQEDKLNEAHAEHYRGTDDDMPDAFVGWLEDLSLDELKSILSLN